MIYPEHMDIGSRNARLYDTLKGMGLFVVAIPDENDTTKIKHLVVSADLPFAGKATEGATQDAAEAGVTGAMQRSQVGNVVASAEDRGMNVVDFPTKL